jgi:hypothetical protein
MIERQQNQCNNKPDVLLLLMGQSSGNGYTSKKWGGRIISLKALLLNNAHEFLRSHPEKVYFYLRHKKMNHANLDQIFSKSKFRTIAHKNQK